MATFNLEGRVAVVTGGNGGIGFGIATSLGVAGANIAVWARDAEKTERALSRLLGLGVRAVGVHCDVTDEDQVKQATVSTIERLGRLDICVANAGSSRPSPFLETTLDLWNEGIRTNLSGTFLCFRETGLRMVDAGQGGALVAVSSVSIAPRRPSHARLRRSKSRTRRPGPVDRR